MSVCSDHRVSLCSPITGWGILQCTFCKALILVPDQTARVLMVYPRWQTGNAIGYTMRTRLSKTDESMSGQRSDDPRS